MKKNRSRTQKKYILLKRELKKETEQYKFDEAVYRVLCHRYAVLRNKKPLAIGFWRQLAADKTGFAAEQIRRILAFHVKKITYLRRLAKGGMRYNLNGSEASEISERDLNYTIELRDATEKKIKKAWFKKYGKKKTNPNQNADNSNKQEKQVATTIKDFSKSGIQALAKKSKTIGQK